MKMHSLIRAVHVDGRIVDAEAAHQLKALATPAAGAASARPPSAKPPGDGAEGEAMPGTTATRSAHLAPAGGLAAASAEAPAAGRVHLVLEPLLAALDALTQAADQALQAVGAGLRRALAWRPWPAAVDPGTPVEPAGGALSPPGPHPNSLCPHQHPPK